MIDEVITTRPLPESSVHGALPGLAAPGRRVTFPAGLGRRRIAEELSLSIFSRLGVRSLLGLQDETVAFVEVDTAGGVAAVRVKELDGLLGTVGLGALHALGQDGW